MMNRPGRNELAKIHIAIKQLGISDDDYRQLLFNRYKKRSAAKITLHQSWDLLAHFKKLGFQAKPPGAARTFRVPDDPQSRKIRALWITLAHGGAVRNPAESALNKYCKRMVGVEALAFATTGMKSRLIEHLKEWQRRDLLKTCGWLLCCLDIRLSLVDRKWIMTWLKKP
jgi:phage gp16-like protein